MGRPYGVTRRRISRREFMELTALTGAVALVGCGDDDGGTSPAPVTVEASAPERVAAGTTIDLQALVTGAPRRMAWESESDPLLTIDPPDGRRARLRAPSVVVDTPLRFRIDVEDRAGVVHSDTVEVIVTAHPPEAGLADGMAWDVLPFAHGVASGDPLPDGVMLWTRVTPNDETDAVAVRWEIAETPAFESIIGRGTATALRERDFTVHVDARGLRPGHTYFYRFIDPSGATSAVGRTKTAPDGQVEQLQFAVASCSSIYSGYFNAYRRIAERTDLDLFIHLGDYIYDFVDEQERVRVPEPYPETPLNLTEWRARHNYYLADPDLRRARAMHPWVMIWDNHDIEVSAAPTYNGSLQAFREWNPIRDQVAGDDAVIYRPVRYGDLVDLLMLDEDLYRDVDTVPGTAAMSMLGNAQFDWLESELRGSTAAWRIVGSQRLFGTVRINPAFAEAIDGMPREIFDPRSWDGYPEERTRLLSLLAEAQIGDNVVISGDSHISLALDLVDQPTTPNVRPVGVEFLATSISRGNFDETLRGIGIDGAALDAVLDLVLTDTQGRNPHHVYGELTRHGYGTLAITAERIVARFWYSEILSRSDHESAVELQVERGANRWNRTIA